MFKPAWGTEAGSTLEGRNLHELYSCIGAFGEGDS